MSHEREKSGSGSSFRKNPLSWSPDSGLSRVSTSLWWFGYCLRRANTAHMSFSRGSRQLSQGQRLLMAFSCCGFGRMKRLQPPSRWGSPPNSKTTPRSVTASDGRTYRLKLIRLAHVFRMRRVLQLGSRCDSRPRSSGSFHAQSSGKRHRHRQYSAHKLSARANLQCTYRNMPSPS